MEAFEQPIHIFDNHNDQNPKINQSGHNWDKFRFRVYKQIRTGMSDQLSVYCGPQSVGRSERTTKTASDVVDQQLFYESKNLLSSRLTDSNIQFPDNEA